MKPSRSTAKGAVRAKPGCSEATGTTSFTARAGAVSPLLRCRRMPASRRTVSMADPPTAAADCGGAFTAISTVACPPASHLHLSGDGPLGGGGLPPTEALLRTVRQRAADGGQPEHPRGQPMAEQAPARATVTMPGSQWQKALM